MRAVAALRRRLAREEGVSLLELAVTMALLSVVGAVTLTTLGSGGRALGNVDDQNRGLADLRVVIERLTRDLREARGVDPGATPDKLTVWIDEDSDYKREPITENVTWRITPGAQAGQYDVERVVGASGLLTIQTVGTSLVSDIAFTYLAAGSAAQPEEAQSVRVDMEYDAIVDAYSPSKTVTFEIRLRNVQ